MRPLSRHLPAWRLLSPHRLAVTHRRERRAQQISGPLRVGSPVQRRRPKASNSLLLRPESQEFSRKEMRPIKEIQVRTRLMGGTLTGDSPRSLPKKAHRTCSMQAVRHTSSTSRRACNKCSCPDFVQWRRLQPHGRKNAQHCKPRLQLRLRIVAEDGDQGSRLRKSQPRRMKDQLDRRGRRKERTRRDQHLEARRRVRLTPLVGTRQIA